MKEHNMASLSLFPSHQYQPSLRSRSLPVHEVEARLDRVPKLWVGEEGVEEEAMEVADSATVSEAEAQKPGCTILRCYMGA